MGVPGLHGFIQSCVQPVDLAYFEGETLAVDASAFLHKGIFTCALELEAGQRPDQFLDQSLRLIELLRRHDITPYFVFDGARLPIKQAGSGRREARARHRDKAVELLEAGSEPEARAELNKAAGVAPWMSKLLIEELRRRELPFLVAPYEADPQLAFLVREGVCAAAITEDSDLVPYGCPRMLFKLDERLARADLVELVDVQAVEDPKTAVHLFDGSWAGEWEAWRSGLLLDLCIAAGARDASSARSTREAKG